jgi:hypothetical protein
MNMHEEKKDALETRRSLSRLVACDLFDSRQCERSDNTILDNYASKLVSLAEKLKIVYTAFDGDHQLFCSQMRRRVVASGAVPANPDSVLGYKDTVLFRQTKSGVLLDDLSVLRGCDELWVFTDIEPSVEAVHELAEGVLVELFYFKRRHPDRAVRFVGITAVALDSTKAPIRTLDASYEALVAALGDDQRCEVLSLSNGGTSIDQQLRSMKYYLFDPLDYKYARFLREGGYKEDVCPLVPYLALRPEDYIKPETSLVDVMVGWARLMSIASDCVQLPSLDKGRRPSQIVEVLRRVWLRKRGARPIEDERWGEYRVPKAKQGRLWAITARERQQYGK